MGSRQRLVDEAARRVKRQMDEAIRDLVDARMAAGLSHQFVANAVGCSRQEIGAIEARRVVAPSLSLLARYGAVVGLDVSLRAYLAGSPLRDAGQLALLDRLRREIQRGAWTWLAEVPVSADRLDRRAVDAVLARPVGRVGIEAIMRLIDAQAQVRTATLKQEAAHLDRMILVLADTRHNRRAARDAAPTLRAAFPFGTRQILEALRGGELPAGNGIAFI